MQFDLNAQQRTLQGTSASRRLRRASKVPGIVYGGDTAPLVLEFDHNELLLKLKKEAFHSSVVNLVIEGKKQQVLLRDYQMHAYKMQVLHIDFQRIDATHEVHLMVPLHYTNEETGPGVKLNGGLVNHVQTEIEVTCLPKNLPEFIEIDLGEMNVGDNIHASQIKLPKGVKLTQHGSDDPILVSIVSKGGAAKAEDAPAADEAAAE